jgi:hypothetical protein
VDPSLLEANISNNRDAPFIFIKVFIAMYTIKTIRLYIKNKSRSQKTFYLGSLNANTLNSDFLIMPNKNLLSVI